MRLSIVLLALGQIALVAAAPLAKGNEKYEPHCFESLLIVYQYVVASPYAAGSEDVNAPRPESVLPGPNAAYI